MNYKLYILKKDLKEQGALYALNRIISYLFRPLTNLMKRSIFLINFWYGTLPNLKEKLPFYKPDPKFIKFPQTDLMQQVRKFWYNNLSDDFDLDGEKISRKDIFTYGGPNPRFTCPICQKCEWLSRVRQKNLFQPHNCSQTKECENLCKKQGDELWVHYHQNFDFFIGCDPQLPAPKCLYICSVPDRIYSKIFDFTRNCDVGNLVNGRRFAYACQVDVVQKPININWSKYDFLFMTNDGNNQKFSRPDIPIILYGHDFWEKKAGYQWVIDWVKPDVFLTSYPSQWKENFKFPPPTKIVFLPLFPSLFFTQTNLEKKGLDLLVIGATANPVYKPRIELSKQISQLSSKYRIEFSHLVGAKGSEWYGPTEYIDSILNQKVHYLNKWSEYLGSAKYTIFGRMKYPILVWKYYETLGSGAIPIFPEVPDLKLLGVKPFEHYIPLSKIEGDSERLKYFLDNYDKYKYIAENAVRWYEQNENKLLFGDFEEVIRELTNYKYPKRLI